MFCISSAGQGSSGDDVADHVMHYIIDSAIFGVKSGGPKIRTKNHGFKDYKSISNKKNNDCGLFKHRLAIFTIQYFGFPETFKAECIVFSSEVRYMFQMYLSGISGFFPRIYKKCGSYTFT